MLLILLGGLIGIGLAAVIVPAMSSRVQGLLPDGVRWNTWALGVALMFGIGLLIGWLPALRGMRLKIVDALAGR